VTRRICRFLPPLQLDVRLQRLGQLAQADAVRPANQQVHHRAMVPPLQGLVGSAVRVH